MPCITSAFIIQLYNFIYPTCCSNWTNNKIDNSLLEHNTMNYPEGVCVKVKYLRPEYDNLEEWMSNPKNILVTRHGRVFIGNGDSKKVFHYKGSKWCNPFTVKEHGLEKCIKLYQEYLNEMLKHEQNIEEFLMLKEVSQIGCFCEPGSVCHRDVIINKLKELSK